MVSPALLCQGRTRRYGQEALTGSSVGIRPLSSWSPALNTIVVNQTTALRVTSSHSPNTPKGPISTPGSPFQTTLSVKKILLASNLNDPWCSLRLSSYSITACLGEEADPRLAKPCFQAAVE